MPLGHTITGGLGGADREAMVADGLEHVGTFPQRGDVWRNTGTTRGSGGVLEPVWTLVDERVPCRVKVAMQDNEIETVQGRTDEDASWEVACPWPTDLRSGDRIELAAGDWPTDDATAGVQVAGPNNPRADSIRPLVVTAVTTGATYSVETRAWCREHEGTAR